MVTAKKGDVSRGRGKHVGQGSSKASVWRPGGPEQTKGWEWVVHTQKLSLKHDGIQVLMIEPRLGVNHMLTPGHQLLFVV